MQSIQTYKSLFSVIGHTGVLDHIVNIFRVIDSQNIHYHTNYSGGTIQDTTSAMYHGLP